MFRGPPAVGLPDAGLYRAGCHMPEDADSKERLLEMIRLLSLEQLAEINDAIRDALISAATGQPARYAINELAHISQQEARRICTKIGLNWETGEMSPEPPPEQKQELDQ